MELYSTGLPWVLEQSLIWETALYLSCAAWSQLHTLNAVASDFLRHRCDTIQGRRYDVMRGTAMTMKGHSTFAHVFAIVLLAT